MKNNSNIYDIDGNIIRPAEDNHRFTIDEAKEKVQFYLEKLKELSEKEDKTEEDLKKINIYTNYCKNLMNYEWELMSKMDQNEFTEYLKSNIPQGTQKTTEEQVNKALNDLKNDIETGTNTADEVQETAPADNGDTTNEESRDDEAVERPISDIHEERTVSQSDLLVERDNVNTTMDEYVDFSEE